MAQVRKKRIFLIVSGIVVFLLLLAFGILYYYFGPFPVRLGTPPDSAASQACWPWPQAIVDHPYPGVTHWVDHSAAEGTVADLFDFDFQANPHLRLELYDQDEDDKIPFDDKVAFWRQGVGLATQHLNENGRGKVIAAWNGLFFQYSGKGTNRIGGHVAPVVTHGKARYNVGLVRWAVGVKYGEGSPIFKVLHQPAFNSLAKEFDFAAESASCLIKDGRPLHLEPPPKPGEKQLTSPKPSTPNDAGVVRLVDHIHTSRTSMAWSKDNKHFYLLIVKDPGAEAVRIAAQKYGVPMVGGWTVADLQRFWQRFGAWCAVNIDGGDVTQLTALRKDGLYDMIPPRWGDRRMRLSYSSDFSGAPAGGTMMYFYIRDASVGSH